LLPSEDAVAVEARPKRERPTDRSMERGGCARGRPLPRPAIRSPIAARRKASASRLSSPRPERQHDATSRYSPASRSARRSIAAPNRARSSSARRSDSRASAISTRNPSGTPTSRIRAATSEAILAASLSTSSSSTSRILPGRRSDDARSPSPRSATVADLDRPPGTRLPRPGRPRYPQCRSPHPRPARDPRAGQTSRTPRWSSAEARTSSGVCFGSPSQEISTSYARAAPSSAPTRRRIV
jgi:hypothetical protein